MTSLYEPYIVAGLASVTTLVTAAYASITRTAQHRAREVELEGANAALRKHVRAMNALNHDGSPQILMAMALFASTTFTNRNSVEKICEMNIARGDAASDPALDNIQVNWGAFNPQDLEAFIEAVSSVLIAAELRWPEFRGRIGHPFKWSFPQAAATRPDFMQFFGRLTTADATMPMPAARLA
jgi:hypothetical protein